MLKGAGGAATASLGHTSGTHRHDLVRRLHGGPSYRQPASMRVFWTSELLPMWEWVISTVTAVFTLSLASIRTVPGMSTQTLYVLSHQKAQDLKFYTTILR